MTAKTRWIHSLSVVARLNESHCPPRWLRRIHFVHKPPGFVARATHHAPVLQMSMATYSGWPARLHNASCQTFRHPEKPRCPQLTAPRDHPAQSVWLLWRVRPASAGKPDYPALHASSRDCQTSPHRSLRLVAGASGLVADEVNFQVPVE